MITTVGAHIVRLELYPTSYIEQARPGFLPQFYQLIVPILCPKLYSRHDDHVLNGTISLVIARQSGGKCFPHLKTR